ncbi:MAG: hypothetical protein JF616_19800 [Fibrobacteres bacterium]|jgi:hypothetical protein|nr:hypothetical protein [Fibrobacterota bacterium]
MPNRIQVRWIACTLPLWLALMGCDPLRGSGCTCSLEDRVNVCAKGKYDGMESVSYRRERGNGGLDSVSSGSPRCFDELSGRQRILVYENGALIDSSAWFTLRTVDCCHGEAKTVIF